MYDIYILIAMVIGLLVLVVYLDHRRNRWCDIANGFRRERDAAIHSERFYVQLYTSACVANQTMAEGLDYYREANEQLKATVEDLSSLVPDFPSVSPDDAIANMHHCCTCNQLFHANHFVVNRTHVRLFDHSI